MSMSGTMRPSGTEQHVPLTVYGTRWCAATRMVRRYLERTGIGYEYRDLDNDTQAANQVRWWAGGYVKHPTVAVNGEVLVEPTLSELQYALMRNGLLA